MRKRDDLSTCLACYDQTPFQGEALGWYEIEPKQYLCPVCQARALRQRAAVAELKRGVYAMGKTDPELPASVDVGEYANGTFYVDSAVRLIHDKTLGLYTLLTAGESITLDPEQFNSLLRLCQAVEAERPKPGLLAYAMPAPIEPA